MRMMRYISLFLGILLPLIGFGQSVEEVMSKMAANYASTSHIEYKMTYELFKGHKSTEVNASYNGYCYKYKSNLYQKIDNTEFVYTPKMCVKTNLEEKAMIISPGKSEILLGEINLDQTLKLCKEKKIEIGEKYYVVTLIIKNQSQLPVSVIKLKIEKKKYQVIQMDIYYTDEIDFSQDYTKTDFHLPHMKIKFNEIILNPKSKEALFDLEKYLSKSNSGKYTPNGLYKEFELTDYYTSTK